ncbi:hypothetical protein ACFL1B_02295 [Nanoarchaeota archaeon]
MKLRRKLYSRGSSFETTIPKPLLFALDTEQKHDVVFEHTEGKWIVSFEPRQAGAGKERSQKKGKGGKK